MDYDNIKDNSKAPGRGSDQQPDNDKLIETHPWEPFIPERPKVLVMGTFPPDRRRWSMDFFYPNIINDFWRVMGIIFYGDKDALYDTGAKKFDIDRIKALLQREGIAMWDTAFRVHREKGNASDKYLQIIQSVDLKALLERMPSCHVIATTGEKAAAVVAEQTGSVLPKMGQYVDAGNLRIWRMPSTSRAYPLPLEKKADYYRLLFADSGIDTGEQ